MDRDARQALRVLNDHLVRRGGEPIDHWPVTFAGWSPLEQVWAFQPWVSPRGCFERTVPCWWSSDCLKWWDVDTHLHVWHPPPALTLFQHAWQAGKYPALVR